MCIYTYIYIHISVRVCICTCTCMCVCACVCVCVYIYTNLAHHTFPQNTQPHTNTHKHTHTHSPTHILSTRTRSPQRGWSSWLGEEGAGGGGEEGKSRSHVRSLSPSRQNNTPYLGAAGFFFERGNKWVSLRQHYKYVIAF